MKEQTKKDIKDFVYDLRYSSLRDKVCICCSIVLTISIGVSFMLSMVGMPEEFNRGIYTGIVSWEIKNNDKLQKESEKIYRVESKLSDIVQYLYIRYCDPNTDGIETCKKKKFVPITER